MAADQLLSVVPENSSELWSISNVYVDDLGPCWRCESDVELRGCASASYARTLPWWLSVMALLCWMRRRRDRR